MRNVLANLFTAGMNATAVVVHFRTGPFGGDVAERLRTGADPGFPSNAALLTFANACEKNRQRKEDELILLRNRRCFIGISTNLRNKRKWMFFAEETATRSQQMPSRYTSIPPLCFRYGLHRSERCPRSPALSPSDSTCYFR